jgi:hypothetical protein
MKDGRPKSEVGSRKTKANSPFEGGQGDVFPFAIRPEPFAPCPSPDSRLPASSSDPPTYRQKITTYRVFHSTHGLKIEL